MEKQKIVIPDLGGVDTVTVLEILVAPGERVEVDQAIMTLESEKASMDVPSDRAGVVQEILVKIGQQVGEGDACILVDADTDNNKVEKLDIVDESAKNIAVKLPQQSQQAESSEQVPSVQMTDIPSLHHLPAKNQARASGMEPSYASPSARKIARELGIDIAAVPGSGRSGRVTIDDVIVTVKARMQKVMPPEEAIISVGKPKGPPWQDPEKFGACDQIAPSKIKKATIKAMGYARDVVVPVTQCDRVDITELEAYRNLHKAQWKARSVRLTMLAFVMKALATTLTKHPLANASYQESCEKIWLKKYVHIGVAVDTPEGLVVPVVQDVDQKSIIDIASALGTLSAKARNGQLKPRDLTGASFTVSSLGGIGGEFFTPVVNTPQAAILGVSKAMLQPIWDGQQFQPRLLLPLSLSYDHRLLDGAQAMRFLNDIMQALQALSQCDLEAR